MATQRFGNIVVLSRDDRWVIRREFGDEDLLAFETLTDALNWGRFMATISRGEVIVRRKTEELAPVNGAD